MNTSLSWMKMYVPDLDVTAQEYTDAMTLSHSISQSLQGQYHHKEGLLQAGKQWSRPFQDAQVRWWFDYIIR